MFLQDLYFLRFVTGEDDIALICLWATCIVADTVIDKNKFVPKIAPKT
jgi:hypothetical protein